MADRSYASVVTLSGVAKGNSCRLTIAAAHTNVMFLIRRIVRPSGIPSATVLVGRDASVSSSFPSWRTRDGPRPLSAMPLRFCQDSNSECYRKPSFPQ